MVGLYWPIAALVIIHISWFSQFLSRNSLVFRLFLMLLAAVAGWAVPLLFSVTGPSEQMISRGIRAEGVGCFFTGLFGGFASTSYSENIGLIGITRVASRYVVTIGSFVLIFLGVFGKFGALAATLPGPVVGAMYCALFGLIAAIGVQQVARCDLRSDRNLLVIGFSLFMGLSLPAYFTGVPEFGFAAQKIVITWAPWLADMINIVGSTGMAVAAIFRPARRRALDCPHWRAVLAWSPLDHGTDCSAHHSPHLCGPAMDSRLHPLGSP